MNRDEMVARLVAQAADEGADLVTLRAMIEEASELGAERVLTRMGLDDASAHADLSELRQLLQAWRDAKASAWKAAIAWVVRGVLALLLVGIAYRTGTVGLLKRASNSPAMPRCSTSAMPGATRSGAARSSAPWHSGAGRCRSIGSTAPTSGSAGSKRSRKTSAGCAWSPVSTIRLAGLPPRSNAGR